MIPVTFNLPGIFEISINEREILAGLTIPIPDNEGQRLRVLRESGLLDSNPNDASFDRFTSLCRRIFKVVL